MRKLMNKKGFSLVELMIVVVIMGILIAVAIPLYGAIQDNANNKTCSSNMKAIKEAAANYKAQNNKNATPDEVKAMFDDDDVHCPIENAEYTITIDANTGAATVVCPNQGKADYPKHTPSAK